jgi:hypothetical protein
MLPPQPRLSKYSFIISFFAVPVMKTRRSEAWFREIVSPFGAGNRRDTMAGRDRRNSFCALAFAENGNYASGCSA